MKKFILAAVAMLGLAATESQAYYPYGYGGYNPRIYNQQYYVNPYTGAGAYQRQVYNPYTGYARNTYTVQPNRFLPPTTYTQSYSPYYGNRFYYYRGY